MSRKRDYCVFELLPADECAEVLGKAGTGNPAPNLVVAGAASFVDPTTGVAIQGNEAIEALPVSDGAHAVAQSRGKDPTGQGAGSKIADGYGKDSTVMEDYFFRRR